MKSYIVLVFEKEDELPIVKHLTKKEIKELSKKHYWGDYMIIEGNIIKGFTQAIELNRIK